MAKYITLFQFLCVGSFSSFRRYCKICDFPFSLCSFSAETRKHYKSCYYQRERSTRIILFVWWIIVSFWFSLFCSMVDPVSVVTAYGFELSFWFWKFADLCRDEGVQFLQEMDPKSKQNPVDYLLNNHIKKYSKAILSKELNSTTTCLKGKFILQVEIYCYLYSIGCIYQ